MLNPLSVLDVDYLEDNRHPEVMSFGTRLQAGEVGVKAGHHRIQE